VDGGAWQDSGDTVSGLTVGSHTVDYKDISGWNKPGSEVVQINDGALTTTTGSYVEQKGSIKVDISPAAAVTAGAQWRLDGGDWQNSGTTLSDLPVGGYTLEFKDITGWDKPENETVQINDGALTPVARSYIQQTGSLQVNLSPPAAVSAGAQWRVDGGAWQNSSATVSGLPVGSHTVEFKEITGWNEPGDESVVVYEGQVTFVNGAYVEPAGSLKVTITPAGAVTAGAQWRVDGFDWQDSGATVSGLSVGGHTVEFIDVPGWDKPGAEIVQVNDGELTAITRAYTGQAGSLQVYISPSEAVSAGGQWRVDGGAWQDSGATVLGLGTGSHLIEFKEVVTWIQPTDRTAVINEGEATVVSGSYSRPLLITEFMASNHSPNPPEEEGQLVDEDGDSSDWIEIYNPTDITIDLAGWYLTDSDSNLAKWQFPAGVELTSGEFLVVFASNKDRKNPPNPLHTNFELNAGPEYLALVSSDGISIVHEYYPEYPDQLGDVSYGLSQSATKLIASGATARYHVPTAGSSGWDWTSISFDDSSWPTATTALSFEQAAVEQGRDVGSPTPGSHSVVDGVYTIQGNGNDIWGNSDNFYYVYAPLSGDGQLTARVTTIDHTHDWAKAGVMIRETLDGGSRHAMMIVTPVDLRSMQWRTVAGDASSHNSSGAGAISLPYWVKMERVGNTFTGSYAPDAGGVPGAWTVQASTSISMSADAYAGLCITSHVSGVLCTATLDNVSGSSEAANDLRDAMLNVNSSLWARLEFYLEAGQADTFDSLILQTKYEDGYAAYLNGEKVAWGNAPSSLYWNSAAVSNRPIEDSEFFEPNSVIAHVDALQTGKNILAIHALNDNKNDEEFLILPELVAASESGIYQYFETPTPGTFNISGAMGAAKEVWFSHERGLYNSGFYLTLSTETIGAEIRYTTNGSTPSASNGQIYTAPLLIDETTVLRAAALKTGYLDSEVETHTYIFVADVVTQSLNGEKPSPEWPDSGVNGQKFEYGMDSGVVSHPIPTMSLVTDLANLFDPSIGIYVNAYNHGYNWERPASLELIYPDDPQGAGFPDLEYVPDGEGGYHWQLPRDMQGGFGINCGVRIRGGYSRSDNNPKHAFRFFFRNEYGAGKLNYPLFSDEGVDRFDKVDLRCA
ncbi:MAG: chitobiase/beta-hexosaminidase C-terminal domain-containing protein, partial [Planctomycetota bacterium]